MVCRYCTYTHRYMCMYTYTSGAGIDADKYVGALAWRPFCLLPFAIDVEYEGFSGLHVLCIFVHMCFYTHTLRYMY